MDYLTTFTGKSGRLLRGTASRLWGFAGGGEVRQVCFQDYLREPAQGDPGCGSPPHRPPAPSNPEGPGELSLPWPPARSTPAAGCGEAAVWALDRGALPELEPVGTGWTGMAGGQTGVKRVGLLLL